jgi:hypothetical protein
MNMVVKWALGALVALGLLVIAVATVEVGLAESRGVGLDERHPPNECGCASGETDGAAAGFSQTGQRRGGPVSWLIGLGLVVVLARLGEEGTGLDVF